MLGWFHRYAQWLHLQWPAGRVESLVEIDERGESTVPGLFVVGDLTGIPLLKNALQTGVSAVEEIASRRSPRGFVDNLLDVAIVGAGVSGLAAACHAQQKGLRCEVIERHEPLATVRNFPNRKPIYAYPLEHNPSGPLRVQAETKEDLLAELHAQVEQAGLAVRAAEVFEVRKVGDRFHLLDRSGQKIAAARFVIVATGRTGRLKRLGVPGEKSAHVFHRLYDPSNFQGQHLTVVGGGDAAVEAALACADAGAKVTLVHRGDAVVRAKPINQERLALAVKKSTLQLRLETRVSRVEDGEVLLEAPAGADKLQTDALLVLIGREPSLGFLERSGLRVRAHWRPENWAACAAFLALCTFLYLWKAGGALTATFEKSGWFPFNVTLDSSLWLQWSIGQTVRVTLREPGFYYAFLYSVVVIMFGFRRIRRRQTPYVSRQTACLMAIQVVPLFLLPYFILPWMGHAGWFNDGLMATVADELFPAVSYGHGREYWRAFGFVLAWPLFLWNVMTHEPLWGWLFISLGQTFILLPLLIRRFGKGAYCGWICSCGALAETLGDAHREKMPHGPGWNRLNLAGQLILILCFFMFGLRVLAWSFPATNLGAWAHGLSAALLSEGSLLGFPLNYKYVVDLMLAGIFGVGLYFWMSGRVWCRFFCPLAALMNVYARFSRFRIFAEKQKCISCNRCTAVCHQGIDVMAFAARGTPMEDPQCVRCSACVGACPTGALSFGATQGSNPPKLDRFPASLVQIHRGNAPVSPAPKSRT